MKEYLAILARIGGDNPPTLEELTSARDGIARELHKLRKAGATDLAALTTLRDTYKVAADAVTEAEAEAEASEAELDAALADVPDPDSADEDESPAADEDGDDEESPVTASAMSVVEAVRRLGITVTEREPAPSAPEPGTTTTTLQLGHDTVTNATWSDLAKGFQRASNSLRAGKEKVLSLRTEFGEDRTLSGKMADDTNMLDSFVSPEAVTAAGGCCSLAEPIRENPVEGSTARPIRDSLTTLGARAGKFTFYPSICDVDGVGLWTCEQDALVNPDDETTWKDCSTSECDEAQEVVVEGIYTCRTVGNFKSRFAPEQWRAELQKLAIQQARVAEVNLFDKMRASVTTTHQLTATGSVYASLMQGVSLASAAIRQDQRLGNVQLDLWMPEWVLNSIWSDLVIRRFQNIETLADTQAQITAALNTINVRAIWSQDIDPIEDGSPGQVDGPLTDFPDTAHGVLAPNGYYTFLDGGQLDMGTEIRDHDLNRQNSLAAFSEVFEGLLARGCNAKGLDLPVEVCGQAPCPTVA